MIREPLAIGLREAEAPLVLAIDIGTSGVRAFVFDRRARPIGVCIARAEHAVRTSGEGEATLDPQALTRSVFGVIDIAVRRAGRRAAEIQAVSVCTFWHSLLGIDDRARPTTRLITWADARPRSAAARLRKELDEIAVHARTGCMLHASYLPAKLSWLRDADPESFRRTARWLSFGEYLYLQLFGALRVSHSMASATGLYEQRARTWDREMLEHLRIPSAALSPIDDAALRDLRRRAAERWPALAAVPWLPALGDGACANVGAGAVRRDEAALTLGTSGALRVVYPTVEPPVVRGGWTYRLDATRACAGGAVSNVGNVLTWLAQRFPKLDLEAALAREADAHGLTALPLLAGDRSPSWNDAARAAIAGMGLGTSELDIAQAMLEGVAYRIGLVATLVDAALPGVATIVAGGGTGLARPRLIQLCADVIGRPVIASAAGEGSARGAAIVALERLGTLADIGAAATPRGRIFAPRVALRERFAAAMARQTRLEKAVRDFS